MKKLIKSSTTIKSSTPNYTNSFTYNRGGQKFRVYTMYEDNPYNFQCQITEIHPYDDADYYWIKKDGPASARLIKHGKTVGYIDIDEYDEDYYESTEEYIDSIVDYMCTELRNYNRNIKPVMVHN